MKYEQPKHISQLRLPKELCILGTGPNGKAHWQDIGRLPILGLNAVGWRHEYPLPKWFMMCTVAMSHVRPACYRHREHVKRIYCETLAKTIVADYYYLCVKDPGADHWAVESGCTIAGHALQVCQKLGVKRVVLCGIDMYGHDYAHGKREGRRPEKDNSAWQELTCFNRIVRTCAKTMDIVSISETKAAVRMCE